MNKIIIGMRHPEKNGDAITAHGAMQAFAAVQAIATRGHKPGTLYYSGAHRTWQTALVAKAVLGDKALLVIEDKAFFFKKTMVEVFGDDNPEATLAELKAAREAGHNLAQVLKTSAYACRARKVVTEALLNLATHMEERAGRPVDTVMVFSHSPFIETAGDPETTPYGLGEADSVVYTVEDDQIVATEYIKAPLTGKTN